MDRYKILGCFWGLLIACAVGSTTCAPHTGRFAALIPHSHSLENAAPAPSSAPARTPSGSLRLSFVDVSHGDATLIECPDGQTLLIDTAKDEMARARLVPFLKNALPRRHIDYLVLTHEHFDHVGGMFE